MMPKYYVLCVSIAISSGALSGAQKSYKEAIRELRSHLANIDDALLKIPRNKSDVITESHAELLKSYRAVRAELDTLEKKLNEAKKAIDSAPASRAVQSIIDDLLEGIAEPSENKSSGVERLLAARSRLYAEAESIRKVQDRLLKTLDKPIASHKKILTTLIDTIGNGLIILINTMITDQIDPLINKSR